MGAKLERRDGVLSVKLFGEKPDFAASLAAVKLIPGRRWNPGEKVWELPDDSETLMKAVQRLAPDLSAEVRDEVRAAQAEVTDDLITRLPEDAEIKAPWAEHLFPFQRAYVYWALMHPHHFLCDEMGLGKTIEAITVCEEHEVDAALVIAPNAVRSVWAAHLQHGPLEENPDDPDGPMIPVIPDWEPIPHAVIDGDNPAKRAKQLAAAEGKWVIVNWEKLQPRVKLTPELARADWFGAVIADEVHRAKNRKAEQTKALLKLRAPVQIAATGTPIMNTPSELWAPLRWLRPEQYTSYWAFEATYVESYPGFKGKPVVIGVRNSDALRFELADKLVRRTKVQVLKDLPPKLPPQVIEVDLLPRQKRAYEAATQELMLDVEQAMRDPETRPSTLEQIKGALEAGDGQKLAMLIPNAAARVIRQRQVATSPALLGGDDESATLDAAVEIIRDNPGKPFVCFTWFKGSAELLAARLRKGKPALQVETFTGDTKDADRERYVKAFQAGNLDVLVCTIATGGTGITLTRADTAIFVEEDYVPAINDQAIDRLHRIGQKSPVSRIVLRARDTVHTKKIAPANDLKRLISGAILGSEPQP